MTYVYVPPATPFRVETDDADLLHPRAAAADDADRGAADAEQLGDERPDDAPMCEDEHLVG